MEHFETNNRQEKTFDEQFQVKKEIESGGVSVEFVDLIPENQKTDVVCVFAPGWGETPETLRESLRVLYESGRRAVSLKHSRQQNEISVDEDEFGNEKQKSSAISDVIEECHIEKVDGIGHSEGAINILLAAQEHPEKFRSIILIAPAGLIGKDGFFALIGRFLTNIKESAKRMMKEKESTESLARSAKETAKYIARNPKKSMEEAYEISESQTEEILKDLHSKGIKIIIIHGVDDPVFPMERMQEILKAGSVDGFYSVKGDHNEIYVSPQKYAKVVDSALDAIEK
ncbi:MAG: alpha/beta hydrolase [bacterium]